MIDRVRNFVARTFGVAIDWRVRDILEAERDATAELGTIFLNNAAQLTDQQRLLEQRVAELEAQIEKLKNR